MNTPLFLYMAAAIGLVAGGSATAATLQPTTPFSTMSGVVTAPVAPTLVATLDDLTDGTYRANVDGSAVSLVVQSGKPVAYSFGNWKAKRVSIRKNIIRIDQAKFKITGLNANVLQGVFTLNGRNTNLTLTRQ